MTRLGFVLLLGVAACGEAGPREAKALDAKVTVKGDRKFLSIAMKVPPLAVVKRLVDNVPKEDSGYGIGNDKGETDVDVPLDQLAPGKHQLRFEVSPPYGQRWAPLSLEYAYDRELVFWSDQGYVVPEGMFPARCSAKLEVDTVAGQVSFRGDGCAGLTYVIAGRPVSLGAGLALLDLLGDAKVGDKGSQIVSTPTLDVEITHAGTGKMVSGKVPLQGNWDRALSALIEKHRGKPVPLGGADKPNDKSLALYHQPVYPLEVLGTGMLSDVDYIAYEDVGAGGYDVDCGTYRDAGGATQQHKLRAVPYDVTIYDRRTGAQVDKKHFAASASNTCPKTIRAGAEAGAAGAAPTTEMRAWVAAHLAK